MEKDLTAHQKLDNELRILLKKLPPEEQKASSAILYSSYDTLVPGKYYLLGYNPGGDPDTIKQPFSEQIDSWKKCTENAYLDQSWKDGTPEGKARYQCNVQALCCALNIDTRKVCATNWFFMRTKSEKELSKKGYKPEDFLLVHKCIMEIVKPKIIFAIGISTYNIVKKLFKFNEESTFDSGHDSWRCRVARKATQSDKPQKLIGLPHFSIYTLYNREEVLKRIAQECHENQIS